MLGKLFGSKSRVKILKLFLSRPDEKFYIRQVSRDLELQLNSVRRELDNLQKFGLLLTDLAPKSENSETSLIKKKNITDKKDIKLKAKTSNRILDGKMEKKYYSVNKNFVLYDEIKSLIIKAQVMYEKDIVKKILEFSSPKVFLLTGFFANNPDMDVDLLLVGKINKVKLLQVITSLEKDLGREINYTVFDEEEFLYRRDMTDVFLYNILGSKKIVVVDDIGAV